MAKYRTKPVVIEAMRLTEDDCWASWLEDKDFFGKFSVLGDYHGGNRTIFRAYISIDTHEGRMRAELGDWIIKDAKGEYVPCKNDIFEATYEPVRP